MPPAKRRRRLSIGNLRCNVRNGGAMARGAIADRIDGVTLLAMNAHECQAALRGGRLGENWAAFQ